MEPMTNIDDELYVFQAYFCFNEFSNETFFIAVGKIMNKSIQEAYIVTIMTTISYDLIFTTEDGWINNFCMLSE